ncbi:MAG TPA: ATP-binding protein [Acidimicrobiales bacterium]|nr:ATP-binding protein [Acidimicrobiales bacterium]
MSAFGKLRSTVRGTGKAGTIDPETGAMWTTPWSWRTDNGIYVGHAGGVWLYRKLPVTPLLWEDPGRRLDIGHPIDRMLAELGATSKSLVPNMPSLARNRPVHILSVTWEERPVVPASTARLEAYQAEALRGIYVPDKRLFVGVELWPSAGEGASVRGTLMAALRRGLGDDAPDLEIYERDREAIDQILTRNGARPLTAGDQNILESWYTAGNGTDVTVVAEKNQLLIDNHDALEFAAVMRFTRPEFQAPDDTWIADALTHREGAVVVSIRGELETPETTRSRARSVQRKVKFQIEEQQKTGDLDRVEDSNLAQLAKEVEDYFAQGGDPLLAKCSVVMARRARRRANETYIDVLRTQYGVEAKPLEHRQLEALAETLPCSPLRANPFNQDLSIGMIAYGGVSAWSELGDGKGAYLGLTLPDCVPCYIDPRAAAERDKPPAMIVLGEPGGGKTFTLQNLALQAVLSNQEAIFINPKAADDLTGLTDLCGGRVVHLSALESEWGAFDPFRVCADPMIAAEMAAAHIGNVLRFEQEESIDLRRGLMQGAERGAQCTIDALRLGLDNDRIVKLVWDLAESSSLFRLGVGNVPREPIGSSAGLTLIEFDRPLMLPEPSVARADYSDDDRIAIAALRLVTRAALEILLRARGGTLIVDEAWTFLSSREGLSALQRLGREGRSQQVFPILATQRIADVMSADMLTYVSRALVLKMTDEREARAALEIIGLEPTPERIAYLRTIGPMRADEHHRGTPPRGLFRDLYDRHASVLLGPTPTAAAAAFSTNPLDRAARRAHYDNELVSSLDL